MVSHLSPMGGLLMVLRESLEPNSFCCFFISFWRGFFPTRFCPLSLVYRDFLVLGT